MSDNSYHYYGENAGGHGGDYQNGFNKFTDQDQTTSDNQPFVLPEPIRALSQGGLISPEEEALAKSFYRDVCTSGLLPKFSNHPNAAFIHGGPTDEGTLKRVRGIFALLDAIDDRLLATVCALILEISIKGEQSPLDIEEVGRRVMGYAAPEANRGAGGALLRAALWMIRFGYNNEPVCGAIMMEKQLAAKTAKRRPV
ncbi:MAG: hypothetical protein ACRBBN_06480 [Methyloligellaceae bacterium]